MDLNLDGTREDDGWSESAERLWIAWTVIVSAFWAVWYLMVPTVQSLLNFAAKIGRRL